MPGFTINQANATVWPIAPTPGSFALVQSLGGTLQITATGGGLTGTLGVYFVDGNGAFTQIPNSEIFRIDTKTLGAIASATQATYQVPVPAGAIYLLCSALSGGSDVFNLTMLSGSSAAGGSGGIDANVSILSPLGPQSPANSVSVVPVPQTGTPNATNPTVASGASVTLLAANANRKYLSVFNNHPTANLAVSWSGASLTSATPGLSNPCDIIPPGGGGRSFPDGGYLPTSAITGYQSSGASTNLISVNEG